MLSPLQNNAKKRMRKARLNRLALRKASKKGTAAINKIKNLENPQNKLNAMLKKLNEMMYRVRAGALR